MFWKLATGYVIGKPVNTQCPKVMNVWKRRKYKMEKASRGPWSQHEHSPRAMQLREYTLKEFWQIFVDDRPFGTDSTNREVNVQSKAVFSYAMTLMDKIRGWEDEESWVTVHVRCMYVDLYKRSFDRRTDTRSGTGKSTQGNASCPLCFAQTGSVRVLSSITNGFHQEQLSSRRRKIFKHGTGFQN